jgi:hypothetical protein
VRVGVAVVYIWVVVWLDNARAKAGVVDGRPVGFCDMWC